VILIEGEVVEATTDLEAAIAEAAQMRELGLSRQQATALLTSRHGIGRREAYDLWLQSEKA
jgi:hypothetical protein